MRNVLIIVFLSISCALSSQTILTIEGQSYTNAVDNWSGVIIPHSTPTTLKFRNNSITSVNSSGYMLQAGEEVPSSTNNNLDGSLITGNKLTWNGTPGTPITHGLFVGYNKNDIIEYNYFNKVPFGVVIKSGNDSGANMTYSSGGVAYNIFKNSAIGIRIKGMNGVSIYNNTFYDNLNAGDYFIFISSNDDRVIPAASSGTKIKNNIFYSTYQNYFIYVAPGSESGLECDYNVYYCEAGTPMFNYLGAAKTFAQWQALGYDTHSKVVNPNFINSTDFVPVTRLDYGTILSTSWQAGLSTVATWIPGSSPLTINQNGTWQVGARIYEAIAQNPVFTGSVVENATASIINITYSLNLANIAPAANAFTVNVNSLVRTVNVVTVSGTKVLLTLSSPIVNGDVVTVSYTKPSVNPLQTVSGGQAAALSAQIVVNNVKGAILPVYVSSVIENATPNILEMTYNTNLANIIPVLSSFSVTINSIARTVSAVTISGTKVQLTLISAIKYGDIVAVSYTKPASSQLQTPDGVSAVSISPQAVINKLSSPVKDELPVTIKMTISPDHVHKILNVLMEYSGSLALQATSLSPQIIMIHDLSGTLFYERLLITGITKIKIPISLKSGIYKVLMFAGGHEIASQKVKVE